MKSQFATSRIQQETKFFGKALNFYCDISSAFFLAVSVFFDKTYFLPISLWTKFSSANTFEIDATIVNKKKQLETLDEYKKSLIFEYVTGKKRSHRL